MWVILTTYKKGMILQVFHTRAGFRWTSVHFCQTLRGLNVLTITRPLNSLKDSKVMSFFRGDHEPDAASCCLFFFKTNFGIFCSRVLTAKVFVCWEVFKNLPSLHTFSSKWFLTQQVTPPKTDMTNWKSTIFNRRYNFIHGCFSSQSS